MLTAVGVQSELDRAGGHYVLLVDPHVAAAARSHLLEYQREARLPARPAVLPPARLHPHAWAGCALYAGTLIAVAYGVNSGIGRLDAFDVGELDAGAVRDGEWWRAWTALTLHYGPDHLAANLGVGVWFGYLAGRLLGPGIAWALIVNGGACADLLEGSLAAAPYRAAGASTAVFTALGLLAAYSWRQRRRLAQHWAVAWSPLVAGVVLLGWLGTAGANTDVFAHLAGFAVGVALGAAAAAPRIERGLERVPQWLAGALALGSVTLAWLCALAS